MFGTIYCIGTSRGAFRGAARTTYVCPVCGTLLCRNRLLVADALLQYANRLRAATSPTMSDRTTVSPRLQLERYAVRIYDVAGAHAVRQETFHTLFLVE